jgi:hypothetical protein
MGRMPMPRAHSRCPSTAPFDSGCTNCPYNDSHPAFNFRTGGRHASIRRFNSASEIRRLIRR